jgi:hypothetical protein
MEIPTPNEYAKNHGYNPFPPRWEKWLSSVREAILTSQPTAGRHVSVDEHPGKGTVINVERGPGGGGGAATGACCIGGECSITTEALCLEAGGTYQGDGTPCDPNPCLTPDCSSCDDLPSTNPAGPPVHINIVCAMSGTCGTGTAGGSMTYDEDLAFSLVGPVGGHIFCAHTIVDNGHTAGIWTGEFTCNGSLMDNQGFNGIFGRDVVDCSWWFQLGPFLPGIACGGGGCGLPSGVTFQMITGPGDPSNTYVFTNTVTGFTMTITITIT